MRAVELSGVGEPLRLVDRPVPEPGLGEALVRVEACGVCGSDLFLQAGGFGADKLPRIPGHEAAGVIEAVGPGVDGFRAGDQVALYYIDSPADSPYARRGRPNLGPNLIRMGVDVDGAFAEYVVRPARTLIAPPQPVEPMTLAVLTDAVGTPYHALVSVAQLKARETLCVLGIGGIGSNAVQIGRHLGARVVAVSRRQERLALARRLGADQAVGLKDAKEAIGGDGADVVVQCAGSSALDEAAIELAGPGGRVVYVGASTTPFSTRSVDLIWRELSLHGSRAFTPDDIRAVVTLHLEGAIVTDHLTASPRPLEEANDALEDLREGRVLRSVLVP